MRIMRHLKITSEALFAIVNWYVSLTPLMVTLLTIRS